MNDWIHTERRIGTYDIVMVTVCVCGKLNETFKLQLYYFNINKNGMRRRKKERFLFKILFIRRKRIL